MVTFSDDKQASGKMNKCNLWEQASRRSRPAVEAVCTGSVTNGLDFTAAAHLTAADCVDGTAMPTLQQHLHSAMMNLTSDLSHLETNATTILPATTTTSDLSEATASRRGYAHLLAAATGMVTLTLTAIVANVLVIVIFVKHRRLRRCKNVYLVGLSLADLGVGLVMPVALADEMLQGWAPEGVMCRVYLVIRDSLLLISLLSILQSHSIRLTNNCYHLWPRRRQYPGLYDFGARRNNASPNSRPDSVSAETRGPRSRESRWDIG
ncbi:hypothetical protein BaRGS_00016563, partial [Batillaria attramentaria]